jgi:hypothetical protein
VPLYAIIQKYLGKPLYFPIVDATSYCCHVDGDMMARVFVWACDSPKAHGESFNIDNGDVWEFRALWNSLSQYYNIPLAPEDTNFTLVKFFEDHEDTWAAIVEKYGLLKYSLADLLGQSAQNVDILLNNCPEWQKLGGGKPWIESRFVSRCMSVLT